MATTDVLAGTPFSINTLPIEANPTPKPAPAPTTVPDLEAQELEAYKQKGQLEELKDEAALKKEKETAEAQAKTTADYAKAVTEDPTRKLLGEKVKERADTTFVPTKETAADMGLLFTLTNIVGFMIGGKSKGNAQQAMSAMNGMLEGHQKGREDLYKKEKAIFEENTKALDKTIEALDRQFKEAMQIYAVDKEAGMAKAQSAIAEHNATFLGDALKKNGLAYSADLLSKAVSQKDKKELAMQKLKQREEDIKRQERQHNELLALRQREVAIKEQEEQRKIAAENDQSTEDAAQAIAKYSQSPPGLRDKNRNKILARAREINPEYNEATYKERDAAFRQYSSPNGAGGKQIIAFNTVADHLNSIEELSKALRNNDIQSINKISNYLETQFGVPDVTNFNAAKQFVSGEVVKAITGTAGALKDREEAQRVLDAAQTPEQLQGAIDTTRKLIAGRTKALQREYEQGTGRTDFEHWLTPSLRTEKESSTVKTETTPVTNSATQPQFKASSAPQSAIDYLKNHPEFKDAFKSKYGYLPEGM